MTNPILLCDLSAGAYVKLALALPGHRPEQVKSYSCLTEADFYNAIDGYLDAQGRPDLRGAAVASRGWEDNGVVHTPECNMTLTRDGLRDRLSVKRLNLVNNFVARALAIPHLHGEEKDKLCGAESYDEQVIAVLGPHYGLGVAGLAPDGAGGWTAMPAEGGHSDLPATNEREWQVTAVLRQRHGYVAREFALSMDGLVAVWQALVQLNGGAVAEATAQAVVDNARAADALAKEAVALCTGWLAAMASDVGLIMGARGGIYLTGALIDLLGDDLFDRAAFCERYADKGRLRQYISEIPVFRTRAPDLELIGLATLFD